MFILWSSIWCVCQLEISYLILLGQRCTLFLTAHSFVTGIPCAFWFSLWLSSSVFCCWLLWNKYQFIILHLYVKALNILLVKWTKLSSYRNGLNPKVCLPCLLSSLASRQHSHVFHPSFFFGRYLPPSLRWTCQTPHSRCPFSLLLWLWKLQQRTRVGSWLLGLNFSFLFWIVVSRMSQLLLLILGNLSPLDGYTFGDKGPQF